MFKSVNQWRFFDFHECALNLNYQKKGLKFNPFVDHKNDLIFVLLFDSIF